MPAPTLNRLRRLWFNIHLWIGVGLFVLLVPLGLSGTALVWRPELDRMLHPERFAVTSQATTLAPSAYLAAAGGAFGPSAVPTRIVYASRPGAPVVVSGLRTDIPPGRKAMVNAWLDPASGKVLSVGSPMGGFIGLMHDLHGQMLIGGGKGRPVVGWLGVFMLVSSLTGLWLWWPRGRFQGAFRWRRTRYFEMNLHHVVGFWMAIPLAILSVTGIWISFPQIGRLVSPPPAEAPREGGQRGGEGGRPGMTPPIAHPRLTADQAAALAEAQAPGAELVSLALPTGRRDPSWQVGLLAPDAERPQTLRVSDATGAVREGRGGFGGAGGPGEGGRDPLARAMRSIHEGEGSIVWKLIVSLAGFAPAVLGVTGVIRWLAGQRRRRPAEVAETVPG